MTTYIPGINIQWPWSDMIANGKKVVETRGYDIPDKYRGVPLALIETPGSERKKQSLKARVIGVVIFEKTYKYKHRTHWRQDFPNHCVPIDDPLYSFKSGKDRWGWVVKDFRLLKQPVKAPRNKGIVFTKKCGIPQDNQFYQQSRGAQFGLSKRPHRR